MAWECQNDRYKTATGLGHPHGTGNPGGSVFPEPISGTPGKTSTLWLEYAEPLDEEGDPVFWLMWYSRGGKPALPGSAVFDRRDFERMVGLFIGQATREPPKDTGPGNGLPT